MKKINTMMLLIFACLVLSSVTTECFYYSDNPGANAFGGAATGALIGGAAGGGRGAAIGAGVGAGFGLISSAAARDDRRRRDDYHSSKPSRRSTKQYIRDLENEVADLRARLEECENRYYRRNRR